MLRALELTNFKCFTKQRVELGALTLLTGLNGMSESTTLQPSSSGSAPSSATARR